MSTDRKGGFHLFNTRNKTTGHKNRNRTRPEDTDSHDKHIVEPAAGVSVGRYISGIQATFVASKKLVTNTDESSMFEQKVKALEEMLVDNHISPLTWNRNLSTTNTDLPSELHSLVTFADGNQVPRTLNKAVRVFKSLLGSLHDFMRHEPKIRRNPDIYTVLLKNDEAESFRHLVKLHAEGKLKRLPVIGNSEVWFQVDIGHSGVSVLGSFAVKSFNKAYESCVENGNHQQLSNPTYIGCKLHETCCASILTIEALEDGIWGIYNARVICHPRHGKLELSYFAYTGKKFPEEARTHRNVEAVGSFNGMMNRGPGWNYFSPSDCCG